MFKYRGKEEKLKGCFLVDVSINTEQIFPYRGMVFKTPSDVLTPNITKPVCKVYYLSWVGLLEDWTMLKT